MDNLKVRIGHMNLRVSYPPPQRGLSRGRAFPWEAGVMTERIEAALAIRLGAQRLRQIAATDSEPERAAELRVIARDMDESAALLEAAFIMKPPTPANDAVG